MIFVLMEKSIFLLENHEETNLRRIFNNRPQIKEKKRMQSFNSVLNCIRAL